MKTPKEYMEGTVLETMSVQVKEAIENIMTLYGIACAQDAVETLGKMLKHGGPIMAGGTWDTETVIHTEGTGGVAMGDESIMITPVTSNDGNGKHY